MRFDGKGDRLDFEFLGEKVMREPDLPWDELDVSPKQKEALRGLGTASIPALFGMILAAPKEFSAFFGEEATRRLQERLEKKLTVEERAIFTNPSIAPGGMGALLDPVPSCK